ncbi:GNAT family N-acetyltransferase [Williamsia deligens]|uniref:GNAT family N-acetyltransferase n=1 Tax=Williamsia deligens TaxID=321325 RepID=A0ABW3G100_9NOCA|nr:GNAT family N-acetyltransferase [Williamsia deligens]MCP2194895.1 Ribosomal protein S18 acetylase RimI [Williamsia deligens]
MPDRLPLPPPRVATPDDAAAIVDLRDGLARWLAATGVNQWQEGEITVPQVADGARRGEWHVAELDGEVVACVRLSWSDPDFWGDDDAPAGYVHGLMVRRDHAGHGWGRALIEWAADATTAAGYDLLRLDTAAHNTTMVDYYRSLGFTVLREADLPAQFGRDMRIVLFERPLDDGRA